MKILIIIAVCFVAMIVWDSLNVYMLAKKSGVLIKKTIPFSRSVPNSTHKILILGDSTAYGTGVSGPQFSTAGRLASLYPESEVVNLAQNGLKIEGLIEILKARDLKEHFNIILIQIGANDIIRLTPMNKIETGISSVLEMTKSMSDQVIILHSGDIGESEFFPWYIKPLLSKRSGDVKEIYMKQTSKVDAQYVDLIDSPVAKLLKENPQKYYANDFLHLSDDGYALWFEEIKKQLK